MPENEKKGITVNVDAALHAEVRQYIEAKGMTMAEFVALALNNELHPKLQPKEVKNMGNTRTIAFQVPEKMYQRIKDYLHNHHMTQKEFFLGLISAELDRDMQISSTQATSDNQENGSEDIAEKAMKLRTTQVSLVPGYPQKKEMRTGKYQTKSQQ